MADDMAELMAGHAARVGWFLAGVAAAGYLLTGDDRFLASGVGVVFGALAFQVVKHAVVARRVVDDELTSIADLLWTDTRAPSLEDDDDAEDTDLAEAMEALAPLFEELDRNPVAQIRGTEARRRERICAMSWKHRRAWTALAVQLEGDDCTCPISGGVFVADRGCALHGPHAW